MLIYSMSVSVDGFIADREGGFEWTAPSEELFRFHLAQVGELQVSCGTIIVSHFGATSVKPC